GSFTDNAAAVRYGYQFWPKEFSLEAYRFILAQWDLIGMAYGVTILVTVIGTAVSLLLVSTLGYGLTQKIPGGKVILFMVVFTMLFNGGIVSSYMIYSNIIQIKNTIWALIVPNLLLNGFTVVLMRSYFVQNVPPELLEAAEIDGAGQLRIYWKIALPLSAPIMATIGLLTAVSYWNDWTNGLYYITDANLHSIQLLLNKINNNIQFLATKAGEIVGAGAPLPSVTVRMTIAAVAIVPVIIIYPFFQKFFAKGITLGGVKG
ncbi:MAG: carbohydrate ABC transporter permease, partial [Clostridiales bacterium]|nr:carbohydrate ABC transporter permease [Clostridiales bacterium]